MATNKNALIRYRTIDRCLQNTGRKWTLQDLIEECSQALYEYEGKHSEVSKRTVQLDIQVMRSDKLGYNAPIIVVGRKYYTYGDPDYTITDLPIDQMDMDVLQESMEMLRQFKDFSLFRDLNGVIQKLEDKIYRGKGERKPIIHLDKNENLKGLAFIDDLYQAIIKKIVLKVSYQSFKARTPSDLVVHPLILKEYNNRWFLIARKHDQDLLLTMALDRIHKIDLVLGIEYDDKAFDADLYYRDTIGVTVLSKKAVEEVVVRVDRYNAPYITTKPLHHSQRLVNREDDGACTYTLRVHNNFELQRLLLGFGAGLEVIKPRRLRGQIKKALRMAYEQYELRI
jgi:predicted DNA-binding transcriptional regulator YafY